MTINQVNRSVNGEEIRLVCVGPKGQYPADGSDENNTFAKFSPSGDLRLFVANPALIGKFNPGESFYLDFTQAPD